MLKKLFSIALLFVLVYSGLMVLLYVVGGTKERPIATIEQIRAVNTKDKGKLPIVYSSDYNISFWGLENAHPFDTQKYRRVFKALTEKQILKENQHFEPPYPDDSVLERVHSKEHLAELTLAENIARFTEIGVLASLPDEVAYERIMVPARYATSGSILAGELALDYGYSINLGGGYHHASTHSYEGFCALADITLSIKYLQDNFSQGKYSQKKHSHIQKVMIIDLDAHQGNGHGHDFTGDDNVFVLDMYNKDIYPYDHVAKKGIDFNVELAPFTQDKQYLALLANALEQSFKQFQPDIIYYIAGTDILDGDPLGALSISADGVIKRDEMVFERAMNNNIPIVMLLAGGYKMNNAPIIADSIENLFEKFDLSGQ